MLVNNFGPRDVGQKSAESALQRRRDLVQVDLGPQIIAEQGQHALRFRRQQPVGPAAQVVEVRTIFGQPGLGGVGGCEVLCRQGQHLASDECSGLHQLIHRGQAALDHGIGGLVRLRGALAKVGKKSDKVAVGVEPEVEFETGSKRGWFGQFAVVGLEGWNVLQQL